jgi:hypothetical protein
MQESLHAILLVFQFAFIGADFFHCPESDISGGFKIGHKDFLLKVPAIAVSSFAWRVTAAISPCRGKYEGSAQSHPGSPPAGFAVWFA